MVLFVAKIKKYYVIWKGAKTGIFHSWNECKKHVQGFPNAQFKSFESESEAQDALKRGPVVMLTQRKVKQKSKTNFDYSIPPFQRLKRYHDIIDWKSIAVDAACSGNPGVMEYRGVNTASGNEIFKQGPFPEGTNNIGEFLALVFGLAMLVNKNDERAIYSDSKIAIGWIHKKKCRTKLERKPINEELFHQIEKAEKWLSKNVFPNKIIKWETKVWGEIPADFGRK